MRCCLRVSILTLPAHVNGRPFMVLRTLALTLLLTYYLALA